MSIISKTIIIVLILLISLKGFSRQADKKIVTNQLWVDYYQYFYFKPKWTYYGDAGYRTLISDFSWQMIHFRPSIRYVPSNFWGAYGGIGFFQTFNKDDVNTFEVRPWQGAMINWPSFQPFFLTHFFRVEERIIIPKDFAAEFNVRLRYRLKLRVDVYNSSQNNLLFVPLYAEWFFDAGQKIHETFSNRSRYAFGLAYKTYNNWILEFNFVMQNSRATFDGEFETSDHLYQFKIKRDLPIRENRKGLQKVLKPILW